MEGMQINFNRFRQGWAGVFKDFYLLHLAYMPDTMKYRVFDPMTNKYDFRSISRRDLMDMPDINFDIHLEHMSDVFQREMWMQLMQVVVNPYSVQSGIVQPHNYANMLERLYQSYKVEDIENFITRPEVMGPPKDPVDEARMMDQGDYVEPNPQENVQQHLEFHSMYIQENWNLIAPEYRQLHVQHISETQLMVQEQQKMLQMSQAAAMMQQQAPQNMLGGGGGFMAQPDVGRSPMQAIGQAQAAGRQNPPGVNTQAATAPPIQG